ncbi:MAG: YmdB family metallophosphoesterase [Victivallales bacterium]|nr:YmdB family metallophosphoesterase [Victivallales bacterium]
MRVLFIGDIVGEGGRAAVKRFVPELRAELGIEFCIANGENMAAGNGYSATCLKDLDGAGVDVFTSGDHIWDQKNFEQEILDFPNVLRPANFFEGQPGAGYGVFSASNGQQVAVLNLIGRTFLAQASNCPFQAADKISAQLREATPFLMVDFHAEATSEKIAMGRFLDGRASAVLGTHTHVPTADEQIFPGGTAYQTDVGMVGSRKSILGREIDPVLRKFTTGMPSRFNVCKNGIRLHATIVELDENGRATSIQRIHRDLP